MIRLLYRWCPLLLIPALLLDPTLAQAFAGPAAAPPSPMFAFEDQAFAPVERSWQYLNGFVSEEDIGSSFKNSLKEDGDQDLPASIQRAIRTNALLSAPKAAMQVVNDASPLLRQFQMIDFQEKSLFDAGVPEAMQGDDLLFLNNVAYEQIASAKKRLGNILMRVKPGSYLFSEWMPFQDLSLEPSHFQRIGGAAAGLVLQKKAAPEATAIRATLGGGFELRPADVSTRTRLLSLIGFSILIGLHFWHRVHFQGALFECADFMGLASFWGSPVILILNVLLFLRFRSPPRLFEAAPEAVLGAA